MNRVLKYLIISDICLFSGLGFISPILAIFIKDNLIGGSIIAAGTASAIFLITNAVLQIIFSYFFKPKDRRWMLLFGMFLIALVPFAYIFLTKIWHMYLVQFIYGIGASFTYPAWYSLFAANLNKGQRGYQWSLYSSGVGIGSAVTAYLGAILAEKTSFNFVFLLAGIFALASFALLFALKNKEIMKKI